MAEKRQLDALAIASGLVCVHYGLGFLLGTGEKAFTQGVAGSLYAVSTSLGILALLVLVKFYWNSVEPIWNLLGEVYGVGVKILVGLMSWAWMIGVVASQIEGGSFILKVLGIPLLPSAIALGILTVLISLLPVEQASRIFQGVLLLSSLALFYCLWAVHGWNHYLQAFFDFIPALERVSPLQEASIPLTTILLTALGMDFQQFIVQAKDLKTAYRGCLLASFILLLLAFLPSAVAIAAQENLILPSNIDGKEAIPFILAWVGGGTRQIGGIFLILCLLVTALGSGGGVLRIMNQTIFDFTAIAASNRNHLLVAMGNAIVVFGVALAGGEIVDLIVSFYAIYVAGVLVPFVTYLLDRAGRLTVSAGGIRLSLIMGSASGTTVLMATRLLPAKLIYGNAQLDILLVGIGLSAIGLLMGNAIDKYSATEGVLIHPADRWRDRIL